MTHARLLVLTLTLAAALGCMSRTLREDVFDVAKVPFGQPLAALSAVYGGALKPPPAEKLAGFQHPSYHLAATLHAVNSGTTPYDVYFVADRADTLRMVIMLARSSHPLDGERAEVEKILTRRYGEPVERPERLNLPGLTMDQIFWAGEKLNVVEAYAAREAAAAGHGGEADGHGQPEAGASAPKYGLFVIYELRPDA